MVTFQIQLVEGYPEKQLQELEELAKKEGHFDLKFFEQQLEGRQLILSCFAYIDGRMIGYKIGFRDRPGYFESHIGGVDREHRRKGVAAALMSAQHDWCKTAGFSIVTTTTEGDNRPMLIANLNAGFEVCGTFWDRRKILKVILQKKLSN